MQNRAAAVVFSLVAHSAMFGVAVLLTYRQVAAPASTPSRPIRYVVVTAPVVPLELEAPAPVVVPPPEPPRVEVRRPEAPAVIPEPVVARPEPTPFTPSVAAIRPTVPTKPAVMVGAFANANPERGTRNAEQPVVQTGGFETPSAIAPPMKLAAMATGAFDSAAAAPRPGTDAPQRVVNSGGFDQKPLAGATQPARTVASTGFDVKPAIASERTASKTVAVRTPVEVLFKPTPAYTDEARAQRIEGEVLLEVEFAASGEVRVLRVVRGLGHGLDEMATRAAAQIRFKPAAEDGKPVDFKANVQIVFRLS